MADLSSYPVANSLTILSQAFNVYDVPEFVSKNWAQWEERVLLCHSLTMTQPLYVKTMTMMYALIRVMWSLVLVCSFRFLLIYLFVYLFICLFIYTLVIKYYLFKFQAFGIHIHYSTPVTRLWISTPTGNSQRCARPLGRATCPIIGHYPISATFINIS